MHDELIGRIDEWYNQGEHQKVVDAIEQIPPGERGYQLVGKYASALNNTGDYKAAIRALEAAREQGASDALWFAQYGYAMNASGRQAEALPYFRQAVVLDGESKAYRQLLTSCEKFLLEQERRNALKLLTEDFAEEIAPFGFCIHATSFSALLDAGVYRDDDFVRKDLDGSGYGWDAVADLYIQEQLPQYAQLLYHDSEAGMFCLYSESEKAVHAFLKGFKEYCDDDANFDDLLTRADMAAWD